jgi:hypothetical protein
MARCFDLPCPRCGARSAVYALDAHTQADCGAAFLLPLDMRARLLYAPETINALGSYRHTDDGKRLRFAPIVPREDAALTQDCARCDRAFADAEIGTEYRRLLRDGETDWAGSFEVVMPTAQPIDVPLAHWCCPSDGQFCC